MTGAEIAALAIKFGPIAFSLIEDLIAVWTTDMTPQEVLAFVAKHRKSYDQYITDEKNKRLLNPPAV